MSLKLVDSINSKNMLCPWLILFLWFQVLAAKERSQ
jgi:hypothetical protein